MTWKVSDKLRLVKGPFRYGYKLLGINQIHAFDALVIQNRLTHLQCRVFAAAILRGYDRSLANPQTIQKDLKSTYTLPEIQKALAYLKTEIPQAVAELPESKRWKVKDKAVDVKLPKDVLLYLAQKGTPLEFRILFYICKTMRKSKSFIVNFNQYRAAYSGMAHRVSITRAFARLKASNILLDIHTPLSMIELEGKQYSLNSSIYFEQLPKYEKSHIV